MIDQPFREFVASLAARTAAPAGGAAAAHTGVLGVALLAMAVRFCRGKPANAEREADLAAAEDALDGVLRRMLPMGERDAAAFERVAAAYALDRASPREQEIRDRAIQEALVGAMVVPEEVICFVRDGLSAVDPVHRCVGRGVAGDLGAGVTLAVAAAEVSACNVRANADYLKDRHLAQTALERVDGVMSEIRELRERIQGAVESLIG